MGLVQRWPASAFVCLTFAIALVPFALVRLAGLSPFADTRALPLLFLMVWSPNIAALLVAYADGNARDLLATLTRLPTQLAPWLWVLSPMGVLCLVGASLPDAGATEQSVSATTLVLLVGLNLVLGPLGEELGWRGYLLPRLLPQLGTFGAALVVGGIWAVWHAPLWFVDSPHAAMPFWVFAATVLCFSVILTTMWSISGGSLWPAVGFHLAVNVVVGWAEIRTGASAGTIYRAMLPWYAGLAALAAGWMAWTTPRVCGT